MQDALYNTSIYNPWTTWESSEDTDEPVYYEDWSHLHPIQEKGAMDYSDFRAFLATLVQRVKLEGESTVFKEFVNHLNTCVSHRSKLNRRQDAWNMDQFRVMLGDSIYQSWFIKYCNRKPRGYPGDYLAQEMLWHNAKTPEKYRNHRETKLGRLISRFTYMLENPKANVSIIQNLRDILKQNRFHRIASIGSGSAIELWDGLDDYLDKKIHLLDRDTAALDRAREKLTSAGYRNVKYVNADVVKAILGNELSPMTGPYDFIYSVGLFDYFSVASGRRLVHYLWNLLMPGGRLLITNAHPDTPTRLWTEYAADWFLNYKSETELMAMIGGLSDVFDVEIKPDKYGVYQYLEITKQ